MLRCAFFLPFIFLLYHNVFSQDCKIFWIAQDQFSGKIQTSNLSGTNVTDIVTGLQLPTGIAVDCTSTPKKIYYSETGASRIMRCNFDGSSQEEVVTGITSVREVELDLANRKIYWARDSYSDDRIQRADMDSLNSNVEDVWTNSYAMHRLNGIGLDIAHNWIFWTQSRNSLVDVIKRKTFGVAGDTIIGDYRNSKDIDVVGPHLYWIWYGENQLMRSYKNGSNVDTILTNISALYFEANTISGKIYWADNTYNKISCCDLDGSNRMDLVTGIYGAAGIALYVNPLTVGIEQGVFTNPQKIKLSQNYPNPFNPETNIHFQLPTKQYVNLSIFNVLGQKVETLISKELNAGQHILKWNADQFPGGVYFLKLEAKDGSGNSFNNTKKLILLK